MLPHDVPHRSVRETHKRICDNWCRKGSSCQSSPSAKKRIPRQSITTTGAQRLFSTMQTPQHSPNQLLPHSFGRDPRQKRKLARSAFDEKATALKRICKTRSAVAPLVSSNCPSGRQYSGTRVRRSLSWATPVLATTTTSPAKKERKALTQTWVPCYQLTGDPN